MRSFTSKMSIVREIDLNFVRFLATDAESDLREAPADSRSPDHIEVRSSAPQRDRPGDSDAFEDSSNITQESEN